MEVIESDGSFFLESIFEKGKEGRREEKRISFRCSYDGFYLNTRLGTTLKYYLEIWHNMVECACELHFEKVEYVSIFSLYRLFASVTEINN